MEITPRQLQERWLPAIVRLYQEQNYDQVIREADALLSMLGSPRPAEDALRFSFLNHEEFLYFTTLFREEIQQMGRPVVWDPVHTSHILFLKSCALYKLKRFADAAAVLRDAIAFNPINVSYRLQLAENLTRLGALQEARENLLKLMSMLLYPEDIAEFYRRYGFLEIKAQHYTKALYCCLWSLLFEPDRKAIDQILYIQHLLGEPLNEDNVRDVFLQHPPAKLRAFLEGENFLLVLNPPRSTFLETQHTARADAAVTLYRKLDIFIDETQVPPIQISSQTAADIIHSVCAAFDSSMQMLGHPDCMSASNFPVNVIEARKLIAALRGDPGVLEDRPFGERHYYWSLYTSVFHSGLAVARLAALGVKSDYYTHIHQGCKSIGGLVIDAQEFLILKLLNIDVLDPLYRELLEDIQAVSGQMEKAFFQGIEPYFKVNVTNLVETTNRILTVIFRLGCIFGSCICSDFPD